MRQVLRQIAQVASTDGTLPQRGDRRLLPVAGAELLLLPRLSKLGGLEDLPSPFRFARANWCVCATSRISAAPLVARGYVQSATRRLPAIESLNLASYSEKARQSFLESQATLALTLIPAKPLARACSSFSSQARTTLPRSRRPSPPRYQSRAEPISMLPSVRWRSRSGTDCLSALLASSVVSGSATSQRHSSFPSRPAAK